MNLVVVLVVMPAMHQKMNEVSGVGNWSYQTITLVSAVLSWVLSLIYPVLALALLNLEPVRRFLETQS